LCNVVANQTTEHRAEFDGAWPTAGFGRKQHASDHYPLMARQIQGVTLGFRFAILGLHAET
jgi:hypothetical protein